MLKLKLQYFGQLMQSHLTGKDPDAGKDWRQKEKETAEDEMVRSTTNSMDMNLIKQTPGESGGQRSLACCSPWGYKELDKTEQLSTHKTLPAEYN